MRSSMHWPPSERCNGAMQQTPPMRVQSFLVCRTIFQDRQTDENLLVSPFTGISADTFPTALRFSLYILLTGEHDAIRLTLQMRSQDGRVVADCPGHAAVRQADPLAATQVCWRDLGMQVSQPGR